ncbi:hypothetical protein HDU79_006045 [Rhizoclosmatium sp. JEL0117]|nr:hypothetical protein HDU79_006045 [Rhizoclosmatium sp. JEL0117]
MPRRKSKRVIAASNTNEIEGPGICGLPTELFDEVCLYLKPVDVLNLGCVNRRLASLTTAESRIWTVLYQSSELPPIPQSMSQLVTAKKVLALISRVGCAFCPTKSKQVDWQTLQRLCSKCMKKRRNLEPAIVGDEFRDWSKEMKESQNMSESDRRFQLEVVRIQRKRDIIDRFATMDPPITEEILECCSEFHRVCNVATPLTNRVFTNLLRTLSPNIKAIRVIATIIEWYLLLHAEAMEGIPEQWSNYMNVDTLIGSRCFRYTAEERAYYSKFHILAFDILKDYAWNDVFPTFDSSPYLKEIKDVVCDPYERFCNAEKDLLRRLPHLEQELAEIKNSPLSMSEVILKFVDRDTSVIEYEEMVKEKIIVKRIHKVIIQFPSITFSPVFKIKTLGATEWFSRNRQFFDIKTDSWDEVAAKASWETWNTIMTARKASIYRHIIINCKPALLQDVPDRYAADMNYHIDNFEGLQEWPLLADFDTTALCLVRWDLWEAFNVIDYSEPSYCFRGLDVLKEEANNQLTAIAEEYNETKCFETFARFYNQKRVMAVSEGDIIMEKYFESKGMNYTTGFQDMNTYSRWNQVVMNRLQNVAEKICPQLPLRCFFMLLQEVQGNGKEADFKNARLLLECLLPSNKSFNTSKAIKKFESYLNKLVDHLSIHWMNEDGDSISLDSMQ